MSKQKLLSIQWRFSGYMVWIASFVALAELTVVLLYFRLDFRALLVSIWWNIPLIVAILAGVVLVAAFSGYVFGNMIKKRLERLVDAILTFERGNFAHRLEPLGEDEIGWMADHLNEMAARVQKQVASLQKLSTEKAEWREQLKQAAVSEERQRLARELHDAVSQQLFAISMMTSALRENLTAVDESTKQQIATVEKMAGDAQSEMRALLLHLRPATLEGKGLEEGIEDLLQELQAKQPLDIRWEMADVPEMPKGIEDQLFRIVQEAMSNVFRHSKASSVTVRLGGTGNKEITLRIVDNGRGFDMEARPKSSSYGLQSIQERAAEIGGVAEIISFPGKGTQIVVKVPIVDENEQKERKP
ncbi:MAG TPA: sensor histidine kinase [Bacillales bacterium]|nr:sensor histidine kinase [Bacillales bacterium]